MITCEKDSDDPLGPSLCDFGYIQKQGFNKYEGHFRESRPELVPVSFIAYHHHHHHHHNHQYHCIYIHYSMQDGWMAFS